MKPAVQLPTVYSKNGGYAPYVGTSDISAIANRNGGNILMTIWRKSPYFSEGMDSLSLGLVESYFLYALYFWSLTYLSTTSLLMLPREPR